MNWDACQRMLCDAMPHGSWEQFAKRVTAKTLPFCLAVAVGTRAIDRRRRAAKVGNCCS